MSSLTLDALAAFPSALEAHSAAFPAPFRHWKPASWEGIPSEHLTAIEQVCHLRDIEVEGYQVRIRRALEEENPWLPSLDTDALARDRAYSQQDAGQVLADFRRARAQTLAMLSGLGASQLGRRAQFEGYGPVTVQGLAHYLCSHDQQHLAGLQWLLGALNGREGGAP